MARCADSERTSSGARNLFASRRVRIRRIVATATALATAATTTAGCYRYTPMNGVTPAAGADVRVRLTDAGAVTLAPLIGNRVESVDGSVQTVGDTSLVIAVRMTTDRLGVEMPWSGEPVTVPRSAVYRLESRSFDRKRTILVSALALGAVAIVGLAFSLDGFGGGSDPGQGGTPR